MGRPTRAAIYCRISKDRTGSEAGVARQEKDCRAHVERSGWELVGVFADNDLSAYSGKPRPAFERLLSLVAAGAVDVIVAWHPDRVTRTPTELERVIDVLDAAGCPVDTVRAGRWDLSTRSGRTQARLIGVVARDESEAKSERFRAMHEHKARAGEYRGSTRHFGYIPDGDRGLAIVESEAKVIREAADRALAGESLNAIVNDLNRRQVPTVKGARWRVQTLRRVLTSHTVCGRREHRGEDVGSALWEPILTRAVRDKLHRIVFDPNRSRVAPARVALLAGLVRCGECGHKLVTQRRHNHRRVYACPAKSLGGCGGVQVIADGGESPDAAGLDDVIAGAVVTALDGKALAEKLAGELDADDEVPSKELAEIDELLRELAEDVGQGRIRRAEWLAARGPLEARREAAEARLGAEARSAVLAPYAGRRGALAEAWEQLTLDQRRAIVAAVIDRVTVGRSVRRGPVFDVERVTVEWVA